MLAVILGRRPLAARKVLHWVGPPQRCCWTSVSTGAPGGGRLSLQTRWAPSAGAGLLTPPPPQPLQRTRTDVSPFVARRQRLHSSAARLKKRPQAEAPPRELDLLRYDMKDLWKGPKPALFLGFAGLIPFVTPTALMAATQCYFPELAYAQLAYGASILSFLGGARWGFALPEKSPAEPDWINLANSVVPPLLAWITMVMSDSITPAASMLIMGLGISLHYDLALLPTYPSWFKALRAVLTVVACLSLGGTLLMNGTFPEKNIFSD